VITSPGTGMTFDRERGMEGGKNVTEMAAVLTKTPSVTTTEAVTGDEGVGGGGDGRVQTNTVELAGAAKVDTEDEPGKENTHRSSNEGEEGSAVNSPPPNTSSSSSPIRYE
jgi:hypothetical protein